MKKYLPLVLALTCVNASATPADDVKQKLRTLYPNTQFNQVQSTPIKGVFEVVMGQNVVYTDKNGRYFIFGNLFDMQTQKDITASVVSTQKATFPKNNLKDALVEIKGDGTRKIALFTDVDCPYCHQLEATLESLDNVTIYRFLFPLDQIHEQARSKSTSIWCSEDPMKAYKAYVLTNKLPPLKSCETPINRNIELGASLGVNGTPAIILTDGKLLPGALSKADIEAELSKTGANNE